MLKLVFYTLGIIILANANPESANPFFSVFLPLLSLFYFAFLIAEVVFYFSAVNITGIYNFYDLLSELWDLNYSIKEEGFIAAVRPFAFALLDMIFLFTAIFYAFDVIFSFLKINST